MNQDEPLEYPIPMLTRNQNGLEGRVWRWTDKNTKESNRLEFKRRVDLSTPGAKAEFIRDVLALANSEGESPRADGHLVIGFHDGQRFDVAGEKYDGATFGEIIDSYTFPSVTAVYDEFTHLQYGRIGAITIKANPQVLHVVRKKLHDENGKLLLSPGQCWGRKSDRKIELTGEEIHARLLAIIRVHVDEATRPLKIRIKELEQSSGPVLEVKRIRFEIEATSQWDAINGWLEKLLPYAREFDYAVKHEALDAVSDVTARTRMGMPVDVARAIDNVLMEIFPFRDGSYHHPARQKFTDQDLELMRRIEYYCFQLTWDACRYTRDIKLVDVGARLYWVLIRFATLNRLSRLQSESLDNARRCQNICTEGETFAEGYKKLGETIADALDAFECDSKAYIVEVTSTGELTAANLALCMEIIKAGKAVDWESARDELPLVAALAVVWKSGEIVGVGAIKRERRKYAASVARKSGVAFPPESLELGYIAVSPEHRGHHLSYCIVKALLRGYDKPVFATTSSAYMKNTLTTAGFVQKGNEWKGRSGLLSLWERQ